jgi:predicted transcriptional regulator
MEVDGSTSRPGRRNDGSMQIRAPRALLDQLREVAAANDRSPSAEARQAFQLHIRRERERRLTGGLDA